MTASKRLARPSLMTKEVTASFQQLFIQNDKAAKHFQESARRPQLVSVTLTDMEQSNTIPPSRSLLPIYSF